MRAILLSFLFVLNMAHGVMLGRVKPDLRFNDRWVTAHADWLLDIDRVYRDLNLLLATGVTTPFLEQFFSYIQEEEE